MPRAVDPFIIKETGGDISQRNLAGWSDRQFEGASLGEPGVGTLRRVISQQVPIFLLIMLSVAVVMLTARVLYLQAWQGDYWRGIAEGNRIRLDIVRASRGLLLDRTGKILAYNTPSFQLVVVPSQLPSDETEREALLTRLLAEVPTELLHQDTLARLSNQNYLPQVIASSLPHDLALKLILATATLSGIRVEPVAERSYLGGEALAHVVGYIGALSADEYSELRDEYQLTDSKGKAGLELQYEALLRGKPGWRQVEVDAQGRERKVFATRPASAGVTLNLTLDSELQSIAYDSLKRAVEGTSGRGGSVVALEPKTGEILALVSYPSFDPNLFTVSRNTESLDALLSDDRHPLFNRAIAGEYPSGSTIKPLLAAAGLEERVITPSTTFLSTGGVQVGDQFFADWKAGGHGLTNVYKAIAESVNTFFYLLAGGTDERVGLGITRMAQYLGSFWLGQTTGLDLPGEGSGFIPTPAWKQATQGDRWYRGDTYNVGIGQGNLSVTPLQMAVAYAALANGGQLPTPHLLRTATYPGGQTVLQTVSPLGQLPIKPEQIDVVQQAMRLTVTEGSGRGLADVALPVAGKTGTAQTGPLTAPHAWFAGYAPSSDPEIVVVVIVERGGEGSQTAVPVARDIFTGYATGLLDAAAEVAPGA